MKINWFGHSCFLINDSLVIDPYKDGSVPGYDALRLTADKVICIPDANVFPCLAMIAI